MTRTLTDEATYGDRGRVVLPAAVRSELGWAPGTRLLVTTDEDGSVHLRPYQAAADALQGMFAHLPGGSLADELLADRHAEAAREG